MCINVRGNQINPVTDGFGNLRNPSKPMTHAALDAVLSKFPTQGNLSLGTNAGGSKLLQTIFILGTSLPQEELELQIQKGEMDDVTSQAEPSCQSTSRKTPESVCGIIRTIHPL